MHLSAERKKEMKMRSKLLKIGAAAVASVLLCGGIFMLIHDDVKVQIQEEKLKPYTSDFSVVKLLEMKIQAKMKA